MTWQKIRGTRLEARLRCEEQLVDGSMAAFVYTGLSCSANAYCGSGWCAYVCRKAILCCNTTLSKEKDEASE